MDRYSTNIEAAAHYASEDGWPDDRPSADEIGEPISAAALARIIERVGPAPVTREDFEPRDERGRIIPASPDLPF